MTIGFAATANAILPSEMLIESLDPPDSNTENHHDRVDSTDKGSK